MQNDSTLNINVCIYVNIYICFVYIKRQREIHALIHIYIEICLHLLTLKIINACFFFEMHGRAKIAAGSSNSSSNSKAAAAAAMAAAD